MLERTTKHRQSMREDYHLDTDCQHQELQARFLSWVVNQQNLDVIVNEGQRKVSFLENIFQPTPDTLRYIKDATGCDQDYLANLLFDKFTENTASHSTNKKAKNLFQVLIRTFLL